MINLETEIQISFSYTFNCLNLTSGALCERDINECKLNGNDVCLNGATCDDLVDRFKCYCLPGYQGEFCEEGKGL